MEHPPAFMRRYVSDIVNTFAELFTLSQIGITNPQSHKRKIISKICNFNWGISFVFNTLSFGRAIFISGIHTFSYIFAIWLDFRCSNALVSRKVGRGAVAAEPPSFCIEKDEFLWKRLFTKGFYFEYKTYLSVETENGSKRTHFYFPTWKWWLRLIHIRFSCFFLACVYDLVFSSSMRVWKPM